LERIRVAIEIAKASKIFVEKADAGDWVRENGAPMDGATTIIYHSIFIQYPPVNVQESILAAIKEKGALATDSAPLAWLRMEPKADNPVEVEVRLTLWPSGEDRRLADVGSHGAPVHWIA